MELTPGAESASCRTVILLKRGEPGKSAATGTANKGKVRFTEDVPS